ncbi:MAG TPA: cupin domain-containing protein [Pseudonocardiaceae bacterium]|nr:cupin domain-containing protein [Pseudonocardiaceae bacterium]
MRRVLAVLVCSACTASMPAAVSTAPGAGVSGTVLGKGSSRDGVEVRNDGPTDVVIRRIVIAPGGSTGWHYHPGRLIAVVLKGTLTRILEDCSVQTTPQGQSIVEDSGARHVHIGRNLGTDDVELLVTYVIPAGAPLAIDAASPSCPLPTAGR